MFSYDCSIVKTISCGPGLWGANSPGTPNCMILSKRLRHCRLEWRPSILLQAMLFALMLLAVISVGFSALPWYLAIPLMLSAIYGTAIELRRYRQEPRCRLFWRAGDDAIALNFDDHGVSLTQPRCHQQGPLWIISAHDAGRKKRHFIFLPDILSSGERRSLRLVAATPLTLD